MKNRLRMKIENTGYDSMQVRTIKVQITSGNFNYDSNTHNPKELTSSTPTTKTHAPRYTKITFGSSQFVMRGKY